MKHGLSVTAALLLLAASPPAAAPDPAAIAAQAQRYRFDLARNFFANPAAERAARSDVLSLAAETARLAGVVDSGETLFRAIEAEDSLRRRFRRHDLYHFLRYAVDIREEQGLRESAELRAVVVAARQALNRAVVELDAATLARFVAESPRLALYAHYVGTLRREARHALAPERQAAVDALEPLAGGGDYPRIVNALQFDRIEVDGRSLDVRRNQGEIAAHQSPEVRHEGARRLFAGYARQRELLALLLTRSVLAADALARLRGFGNALEAAAFDRGIDPASPRRILEAVTRHAPAYRQWQQRVTTPQAVPLRWLPDDAVRLIVGSAARLGPVYGREFADLLRAENGRADLAGGEHRLPIAGTASVYPTGVSAIYMGGYEGTLLDLIILAHEGGHAVQAQLMERARVPMAYAGGPGYLTESYGRFQELLLLDELRRSARTAEQRRTFGDALAWRLYAVFPSAEEASVELAIHDSVRERGARTADALDSATAEAGAPFNLEYERLPERRGLWMLSEGYYMAPLHEIDDLYASLLAVRYFRMHRRDPAGFRRRYLRLLARGYDDEAGTLVAQSLGFDFLAPGFAEETMEMLRQEVEALYRS
jgi:oligoendopeptidase F